MRLRRAGVSEADAYHRPPADTARYGEMVLVVTRRFAGRINDFEILNELDSPRYFHGANTSARVVINGGSAAGGCP